MAKKDNVFTKAKAYQRKHPRIEWQECIRRVSKKKRKKIGAAKSSNRQTGKSKKSRDVLFTARKPGARIPRGGKKVTYYERRKNRSDQPGKLTGIGSMTTGQLLAAARKKENEKIDKLVLRKFHSSSKRDKRKMQKQITELKASVRRLS